MLCGMNVSVSVGYFPFTTMVFVISLISLHHHINTTGRVQEWSEECIRVFHQLEAQQLGLADREVCGQKAQGGKGDHRTRGGAGTGPGKNYSDVSVFF